MPLHLNNPAPEFSLYSTDKHKVSLKDFRDKNVVLLFFPFAFSGTCTRELCEMRDNYSAYQKLNAEVIAISVDSLYTNAKYKEVYTLNFPLLSDFNKQVSADYDSLMEDFAFEYHGVSKRASFVIDREGILVYSEILASPGDYPDMQKIRTAVESLK